MRGYQLSSFYLLEDIYQHLPYLGGCDLFCICLLMEILVLNDNSET